MSRDLLQQLTDVKIVFKNSFVLRLEQQIDFISIDSVFRARKFQKELISEIKKIPKNPYKHRKSIYFNDNNIRDLVFKGYTIVFRINDNQIEIFGFVNFQKSPIE